MVSLPEITPTMSIVVSPGASLILGQDVERKYAIVWKRIEADPLSYPVHMRFSLEIFSENISSCFSDDLKFAYLLEPSEGYLIYVDLINKICGTRVLLDDFLLDYSPRRLFCAKGILAIVNTACVEIFDWKEFKSLQVIHPPDLTKMSPLKSKLSPNGNIIAVPSRNGEMNFFQILNSGSS